MKIKKSSKIWWDQKSFNVCCFLTLNYWYIKLHLEGRLGPNFEICNISYFPKILNLYSFSISFSYSYVEFLLLEQSSFTFYVFENDSKISESIFRLKSEIYIKELSPTRKRSIHVARINRLYVPKKNNQSIVFFNIRVIAGFIESYARVWRFKSRSWERRWKQQKTALNKLDKTFPCLFFEFSQLCVLL